MMPQGYTCDGCQVFYPYGVPAGTFERRCTEHGTVIRRGKTPSPLVFCIGCTLEIARKYEPFLFDGIEQHDTGFNVKDIPDIEPANKSAADDTE